MKRITLFFLLALFIISVSTACKDEDPYFPTDNSDTTDLTIDDTDTTELPNDTLDNSDTIALIFDTLSGTFQQKLVKRWAPIHYQLVHSTGSHGLNGKADFITAIDFDGDWVATNNWNNIDSCDAVAHCYYSVVETSTTWFLLYAFYHPRDWTDISFLYNIDEHENDLEGVLMVVEKDSSTYGELQAAITVYHKDFYSYVSPESHYVRKSQPIEGVLKMISYNGNLHPVTTQEAKGHGLEAYQGTAFNNVGVVYYPSYNNEAEVPDDINDKDVKYKLVNIFEEDGFWDHRTDRSFTESDGGSLLSSVGSGSANPPWNWRDDDDGIPSGYIATHPMFLVVQYFTNLETFSNTYIQNQYK